MKEAVMAIAIVVVLLYLTLQVGAMKRRLNILDEKYSEALRRARLAEIRTDEMSKRMAGTPH